MENKTVRLVLSSKDLEGILGYKLVTDFNKFRVHKDNLTEADCENLLTEYIKNYFDSEDLTFKTRLYHKRTSSKYLINSKLSGEVIIMFPKYVDLTLKKAV